MDIKLHPTLPSKVIMGYRVRPDVQRLTDQSQAQKVLVAIVKGTFAADDPDAKPLAQQAPVFDQDVFFNSVRNADFATGKLADDGSGQVPVAWSSQGPAISLHTSSEESHYMRVEGAGRVTQPISFVQELGGRTFVFSFQARSEATLTIGGIQVESKSGVVVFTEPRALTSGFCRYISGPATWPAGLSDKEVTVVLMGADATAIEYDQVQLMEGTTAYDFDLSDTVRYEHDLAIYKPRMDVVILGEPRPPKPNPIGGTWHESVVSGTEVMSGTFADGGKRVTFGWQPRETDPRLGYAGDAAHFEKETMKLPNNFNNLFFNGGDYQGGSQPVFSHAVPGSSIKVETSALYPGGAVPVTATHWLYLLAPGPRAAITFRTAPESAAPAVSQALPMAVDTVVYDKATGQYSVVWRGVWEFASQPADRYVSLALS